MLISVCLSDFRSINSNGAQRYLTRKVRDYVVVSKMCVNRYLPIFVLN